MSKNIKALLLAGVCALTLTPATTHAQVATISGAEVNALLVACSVPTSETCLTAITTLAATYGVSAGALIGSIATSLAAQSNAALAGGPAIDFAATAANLQNLAAAAASLGLGALSRSISAVAVGVGAQTSVDLAAIASGAGEGEGDDQGSPG